MFDHYIVSCLAQDIEKNLTGLRVQKIWSGSHQSFLLKFKSDVFFLIDLSAQKCHGRIINSKSESQDLPQPFLMALRKTLEGAKLIHCQQIHEDRTLLLTFQGRTVTYDTVHYHLYIEFMGRHANALITDEENRILYAYKQTPFESQSEHIIRPGQHYKPLNPTKISPQDSFAPATELFNYSGFYKKLLRLLPSQMQTKTVGEIHQWISTSREFTLYLDNQGDVEDFHQFFNPERRTISYPDLSSLLEAYYGTEKSRSKKLRHAQKLLLNRLHVVEEKIEKLEENLEKTGSAESYKRQGELLLAYLHDIKGKQEKVELIDYYENRPLVIHLDATKTPLENAQYFYRQYEKLSRSRPALENQLSLAKEEKYSLQQLLYDVEQADTGAELEDIYAELEELKLMPRQKRAKITPSSPRVFVYLGQRYEVGKNNKQNDEIRRKVKNKDFLWFHAKNIPGSHVVLHEEAGKASEEALIFGAKLAAYYSRAKGQSIAVEYTRLSKVKKAKSSAPGFVNYHAEGQLHVKTLAEEILPYEKK